MATEVLWSAPHGVICLALSGRLAAAPAPPEAAALSLDARIDVLLRQAVDTLLAGWRARAGA